MKGIYDRKVVERHFSPGDHVLVLLPVPGNPLSARFQGPYEIEKKTGNLDYVFKTPDRRKKSQLCHINMIKPYHSRENAQALVVVPSDELGCDVNSKESHEVENECHQIKTCNSEVLADLDSKLGHLPENEKCVISELLKRYTCIFPDVPSRTHIATHDVDVGDAAPVKQHHIGSVLNSLLKYKMRYHIC